MTLDLRTRSADSPSNGRQVHMVNALPQISPNWRPISSQVTYRT